ncbi:hypothetical protein [[Phormidium] sp. ETS-05]|uniref:hypothetical protein n=1 Tax=[Phormidium] sp. ETS-05 TaxID=222819 RepID=UPI0018EF0D62|nr:hypothetical protein [[Phormidium] sp. ETS-05]
MVWWAMRFGFSSLTLTPYPSPREICRVGNGFWVIVPKAGASALPTLPGLGEAKIKNVNWRQR